MTRKIGRYEILGPLATGGMAEILLARLVGPSGFERPVVIKRIRPDLDHDELVSLFLAEARLAAKVRHANVVAVEDLGTDDDAPYLVMEYLEGESVANVIKMLATRDEKMGFGSVAYVVSEACAGLHAAHELRDLSGELVGLVHRDVSPQNVFVTYDGAVKVVDFGIARTAASAETDPGKVRGKFAYMAPEQITGDGTDRRTDIFSLGIVFYELLTGYQLFKRFDVNAAMRAIVVDPIVAPRRLQPKVPKALESICMRALSRSRDDRYATAAEMRRELLVAMRQLASEEPSAELATLMVRCFADRIEDKRVLLRNVREGSVVDHIPVGDINLSVELPGTEELTLPDEPPGDAESPESAPAPRALSVPTAPSALKVADSPRRRPQATTQPALRKRNRSRAIWLAVAALVAGTTIAAVFVVRGRRATPHAPSTSPTASEDAPLASASSSSAVPPSSASVGTTSPEPPAGALVEALATPSASPSALPAAPASPATRRARPLAGRASHASTSAASAEPSAPAASASARGFRRFQ